MRRALPLLAALGLLGAGCQELAGATATEVPGAAATAARAAATAIPTLPRAVSASPVPASPAASPVAGPSPSPRAARVDAEQQAQAAQRQLEQALATPSLPGIEALLVGQVSLATPTGGQVMDRDQMAQWLRDRAGPGIHVTSVEQSSLAAVLQVVSEGWPAQDPTPSGRMVFHLHRYDAAGRPDDDRGDWKIDTVSAE